MPKFKIFINMLYIKESQNRGKLITENLTKDLNNRLYVVINTLGGVNFDDVNKFVENASLSDLEKLNNKLKKFPSTMGEIMKYLGAFEHLKNSEEYKEILKIILGGVEPLNENIEYDRYGFMSTDTNPYFLQYISPQQRKALFKIWDSRGKADFDDLKLVGVKFPGDGSIISKEIAGIVYPVLKLQWEGNDINNTNLAKKYTKNFNTINLAGSNLVFKLEIDSFDYGFDETHKFGDVGYACWNLIFYIKSDETYLTRKFLEWLEPLSQVELSQIRWYDDNNNLFTTINEIFPDTITNNIKWGETAKRSVLDRLWWEIEEDACEYFCDYCNVSIVIV